MRYTDLQLALFVWYSLSFHFSNPTFNLNNSPTALPRGFRLTSPWERSELPKKAVPGEAKYKISVFGPEAKMKPAEYPYGLPRG